MATTGLLQMAGALKASGVTDEQFKRACRNVGIAGDNPNAIRRGSSSTRMADQSPDDSTESETTEAPLDDDSDSSSDSDESSSSSDSDDSSSSGSSTGVDVEPVERAGLMSHDDLFGLAARVTSKSLTPQAALRRLARPLTQREHDGNFETYGCVREPKLYPGESYSQMSSEEFLLAATTGLDTVEEARAALAFAKRGVARSAPEAAVTQRMRDEKTPDAQRVRDAFGLGSEADAKRALAEARALAKAATGGGK